MGLLEDYLKFTLSTAKYPDAGKGTMPAITYCGLGFGGEVGEVSGKLSKLIRDGDTAAGREAVRKELGDCVWFFFRLCDEMGFDIREIIRENMDKLSDRSARGVIGGNGDSR
jgi:NTP pyrophosphatase (non-canonical NTP hydrolase)